VTLTRTLLLSFTTAALVLVPMSSDTPAFFDDESSLQLQVTPRETEVFIDNYLAGRVDDFDGRFQRLHIQPGEHELTLYLDGHRKVTQTIQVRPRASFRIRYVMTPLAAGEAPDARPSSSAKPPAPFDALGRESEAAPVEGYGSVAIRVQPAAAEVVIDGQRWEGATERALVVQLAAGSHRLEIRKEGYRSYTAQIDVHPGATSPINISLSKGEGR
jgi:PEGA domain